MTDCAITMYQKFCQIYLLSMLRRLSRLNVYQSAVGGGLISTRFGNPPVKRQSSGAVCDKPGRFIMMNPSYKRGTGEQITIRSGQV